MPQVMGYSIRAENHRYTEWRDFESGKVLERELYDHRNDAGENVNLANNPAQAGEIKILAAQLQSVLDATDTTE